MENLVKKAKSGDSGAFAQLIRMNTQSMYKVAWAYLKNDEDVADAIQETILKCYEKLSTLKKDSRAGRRPDGFAWDRRPVFSGRERSLTWRW